MDERVPDPLHALVCRWRIGEDLDVAYQQMAQEEPREAEALEWAEAMLGDVTDEQR